MSNVIHIKDSLSVSYKNNAESNNKKSLFDTKVIIRCNADGKIIYSGKNLTVLGGRTSVLESIFDLQPDITHKLTLNNIMNIPHSVDALQTNAKRKIGWFMIGNGAENVNSPDVKMNPRNYETKLYSAVPFRCVPINADLSPAEREKYRLRKILTLPNIGGNQYVAYYAKKVDINNIYVTHNDSNYIPIEGHTIPVLDDDTTHPLSNAPVLVYTNFTLTVEPNEFKEYYRIMNNDSLIGAKISEIGLVYAADLNNALENNNKELSGAELFAKVTTTPIYCDTEYSSYTVIYEIST